MLHYNKHADLNERIRTPVTNYKAVSHYRACLTMQGRAVCVIMKCADTIFLA